jgi:hypothetical protein
MQTEWKYVPIHGFDYSKWPGDGGGNDEGEPLVFSPHYVEVIWQKFSAKGFLTVEDVDLYYGIPCWDHIPCLNARCDHPFCPIHHEIDLWEEFDA